MEHEIEEQDVTVFWDFSSTQNPSAAAALSTSALVKNICSAVGSYGSLKSLRVYWDYAGYPIQPAVARIRSELSASGVCLVDCPAEGRKDGAMKKMLVDLIIHAWDHEAEPHAYVVITTDRDVAYALSRLRMKEYRIILLSPRQTHSDLASQATVQLDWTKVILGLTSLSYTDSEDIPATSRRPFPAAAGRQPSSTRLRGETFSSFHQEVDPSLPNPYEPPPGPQSLSPFLGSGLGPGLSLPQTPPRVSAWSTNGDFHAAGANLANPISSNRTTVGPSGISGVSSRPPNLSRDTAYPPEHTFDPFNESDEFPLPSLSRSGKDKNRESVTLSSESGSSDTRFSFVKPLSTGPTSVGEKPGLLQPSRPTTSDIVDIDQPVGNPPSKAAETPIRVEPSRLPTPPVLGASLPTAVPASTMTMPLIPVLGPAKGRTIAPSVARIWNPLINTLRANGGRLSYIGLPPKLLKSYPGAYSLAGRSKYKQYIEQAVESGIVSRVEDDPTCPYIQLTVAYM